MSRFTGWMLVGAGGHARSVADVITRAGSRVLGLCADSPRPDWLAADAPTIARPSDVPADPSVRWLVAIGDPTARRRMSEQVVAAGHQLGILIAATATVADDVALAGGVMILEHAHVGPGSMIGTSTIVNTGATVEHDARIGAFTHVAPRAVVLGGGVVGDLVLVGSSSVILSQAEVGSGVTVGAGAVVTRSTGPGVTLRGVPARPAQSGRRSD